MSVVLKSGHAPGKDGVGEVETMGKENEREGTQGTIER